jgi:hypothetical protein
MPLLKHQRFLVMGIVVMGIVVTGIVLDGLRNGRPYPYSIILP